MLQIGGFAFIDVRPSRFELPAGRMDMTRSVYFTVNARKEAAVKKSTLQNGLELNKMLVPAQSPDSMICDLCT